MYDKHAIVLWNIRAARRDEKVPTALLFTIAVQQSNTERKVERKCLFYLVQPVIKKTTVYIPASSWPSQ